MQASLEQMGLAAAVSATVAMLAALGWPAAAEAFGVSGYAASGAIGAAAVVGAAALLALALLGLRATRAPRFARDLMGTRDPALLTDRDGIVRAVNARMEAMAEGQAVTGSRLLDALEPHLIGLDAGMIYRLCSAAEETGIAFSDLACTADSHPLLLSVRPISRRHFAWTIHTASQLPRALQDQNAEAMYGQLPVPHLLRTPGGVWRANPAYREVFGELSEALLDKLPPTSSATGGRVILPGRGGQGSLLCRVFAVPPCAGAEREYLIFALGSPSADPAADGAARTSRIEALEVVPVALMQVDLDGRLLWCNALAREAVGGEVAPGMPLDQLVEPLGRPLRVVLDEASGEEPGGRARGEMVRLRGDAYETFLQIAFTRVRLEEHESFLAVLTDASELRQLEDQFAQSQKMEAVGKLAGGVAHDFNNVLTAISGHCDLLMLGKDVTSPDYSDLVQVRQNANRAAALVRHLLAFSRKQTLNPSTLTVEDVVSDALYLLDRLIGERIALHCSHGHDLWPVRADPQQFEQALMNLVVNARDAMKEGGTVMIATRNARVPVEERHRAAVIPPGDYVELSVTDSGPGIDEAVIDRIFEPFFTTKPKGEGTGLGLSTVYGIVKQSGGYVYAENMPGQGCCFRVLLPRAEASAAPVEAPAPPRREDTTGNGTVLLVEDEDSVRTFALRALELRGYEVIAAPSAEEAMEVVRDPERHVDVLVSDVVMPGMDGPTFASAARKLRPDLRLIFISGYAEENFRKGPSEKNFLFLAKPFSLNDLAAKVKEAMKPCA